MPARKDMPSTVRRSGKRARDTWGKTHDAAVGQYGEGERAHRTAFASLKHTHEKVGDHWEPKGRSGPSEPGGRDDNAGGVDATASKAHLMELARRLDIPGRSRMTKPALVDALQRANERETARARR